MSNYYCERCGKAVIDNGWSSYHTCTPPDILPKP